MHPVALKAMYAKREAARKGYRDGRNGDPSNPSSVDPRWKAAYENGYLNGVIERRSEQEAAYPTGDEKERASFCAGWDDHRDGALQDDFFQEDENYRRGWTGRDGVAGFGKPDPADDDMERPEN